MTKKSGRVFADIDISLDGFIAGDSVSKEMPLGIGGERLIWYGDDVNDSDVGQKDHYCAVDAQVLEASATREGAVIMGRRTFDMSVDAWGECPPIHKPCFVLTHRPAPKIERQGGTSFTFVTSIGEALNQARHAANGRDVGIMGGANTIRSFLLAGTLDELHLHLVPVFLGSGIRLFDGLTDNRVHLRKVNVRDGKKVIHMSFAIMNEQAPPTL